MRVLISVFECNPMRGSDSFVGWSYVLNAAKHNKVYALTRTENKKDIEQFCSDNKVPNIENITFLYADVSRLFTKGLYKFNKSWIFLASYMVWQNAAYKCAKKVHREMKFDVVHHVSIADFRVAGKMWKLGIPFIYGPVGGAQITPEPLKCYTRGHERNEKFREFLNVFLVRLPGYKKAINKAEYVFVSNDETADAVRKVIRKDRLSRVIVKTELCIDDQYLLQREKITKSEVNPEKVHFIVSGRLIYRKGIEFLLDAIPLVDTKQDFVVDIYGAGRQENYLKEKIEKLGISDHVIMHGKVAFSELQEKYMTSDALILPSLRETTGTAVIEAMANKLPVISFKQNGVKNMVGNEAGILVPVTSTDRMLEDMAKALKEIIESPELRIEYGENGYNIVKNQYTWSARAEEMNQLYHEVCAE